MIHRVLHHGEPLGELWLQVEVKYCAANETCQHDGDAWVAGENAGLVEHLLAKHEAEKELATDKECIPTQDGQSLCFVLHASLDFSECFLSVEQFVSWALICVWDLCHFRLIDRVQRLYTVRFRVLLDCLSRRVINNFIAFRLLYDIELIPNLRIDIHDVLIVRRVIFHKDAFQLVHVCNRENVRTKLQLLSDPRHAVH